MCAAITGDDKFYFTNPLLPLGDYFHVSAKDEEGWDSIRQDIKSLESQGPFREIKLYGLQYNNQQVPEDIKLRLFLPILKQHANTVQKLNIVAPSETSSDLLFNFADECVKLTELRVTVPSEEHAHVQRLEKFLTESTNLKTLYIRTGSQTEEISTALDRCLMANESIRHVHIYVNQISSADDLHPMVSKLSNYKGLKELQIIFNSASNTFFNSLRLGLHGNSTLDDLILSRHFRNLLNIQTWYTRTSDVGLQLSCDRQSLEECMVNDIDETGFSVFLRDLGRGLAVANSSLCGIRVVDPDDRCRIIPYQSFVRSLGGRENTTLKHLTLNYASTVDGGAQAITSFIGRLRGLRSLDFSELKPSDDTLCLSHSLHQCPLLECLSFHGCELGAEGCCNVYRALAQNACKALRCLQMGGNILDTNLDGRSISLVCDAFISMLENKKSSLTSVEFDDLGFNHWGESLFSYKNIKELAVQRASGNTLAQIGTALQSNSTLLSLKLMDQEFTYEDIRDFFLRLPKMTGLRHIDGLALPDEYDDDTHTDTDSFILTDVLSEALSKNYSLRDITDASDKNDCTFQALENYGGNSHQMVWLYIQMNRRGRYLLHDDKVHVPAGAWPLILSKMTTSDLPQDLDCLFYFLRHKPDLVSSQYYSNAVAQGDARWKRKLGD